MNVTINIIELASELADMEIENARNTGEENTIEDENGCIIYDEKTQDIFNDLYDKYYSIIESCNTL